MIVVLAKAIPKDEEACEKIVEFAQDLIENSRKEDGNVDYNLYSNTGDGNLLFVEQWESKEILNAHLQTEHFLKFGENIADLVALNRGLFSGKLIFTEHSSWEFYTKARKLAQLLCYRRADKVVVLSETAAQNYRKHGLKNVEIIPNAVREIPKFSDKGHKRKELLAIGRIEDVKGYDNLIAAINVIKNEIDGWKVKIYGTGSKEDDLKNQIKALGVEQYVELSGPTSEVLEKLHEASGYLLTSRNEAFPMVVLESLACGTPIIAYSLPIIREINRDNNAIIEVRPRDDCRALGKAIVEFVRDKKMREDLSIRSLDLAKNYSLQTVADKWKKLFEKMS